MPIGPSFFIVRSFAVPWVWVPGLGWCHLGSIRAWQNNGEKCEEVLTQARVGTADRSHLPCQLGLGLLFFGWNVNISSQPFCGSSELAKTFCANSPGFPLCVMVKIFPSVLDGASWCVTTSLAMMCLMNCVNQKSNSKFGCYRNYSRTAISLGMIWAWFFSLCCCIMMLLSVTLNLWSVIWPVMILQ